LKIVILGAGYVGLVTAAGFAELGNSVLCVDVDPARVARLQAGECPLYERGLPELLARNREGGRLRFANQIEVTDAEMYFLAVPTPQSDDGSADVSAVLKAADDVASVAVRPAIVVVKSTVPVGTNDAVQARLEKATVRLEAASNPEFLREGTAVEDFLRPDRVVCGLRSPEAREAFRRLYASLTISRERLFVTDPRTSELIKYVANSMLAMRISFMNEISQLCDAVGADVADIRLAVGADHRIGLDFLYPGPGYGGSCFPKDVAALEHQALQAGVASRLVTATHEANAAQRRYLVEKLRRACDGELRGKTIVLWGLAYKAETDDVRESPALHLARALLEAGARVRGHDPEASENFHRVCPDVSIVSDNLEALDGADALCITTEWRLYRGSDLGELVRRMRKPAVVDARNVWVHREATAAGLRYFAIGSRAGS